MQVLVIDDDPDISVVISELFPTAQLYSAEDGLMGLRLARKYYGQLDLVILDIKMPYDGVQVAFQLRYELPRLKILPYSYSRSEVALFQSLGGMADLLTKPADPATVRQRIEAAMAMPPPRPPTSSPALAYIRDQAVQQERAQQDHQHIAVLFANAQLGRVFQPMLTALRQSWYAATSATQLIDMMDDTPIQLLITDTGMQRVAQQLAQRYQIPILVVAFTVAEGCRALYFAQNVVVWMGDATTLRGAVERIIAGQVSVDSRITNRLRECGLTRAEQAMIPFLLQGAAASTMSQALGLSEHTIRKYSSRIFAALGCRTSGDLFEQLNREGY